MTRRGLTLVVSAVLALALTVVGSRLPVPYVALAPGVVADTLGESEEQSLIRVEGRETFPTEGRLALTTVDVVARLNLGSAVRGWFSDRYAVVPREQVFPPGQTAEQTRSSNIASFTSSQTAATAAALTELGVQYSPVVGVGQVNPGAPADGVLQPGDTLLAVDGRPVTDVRSVVDLVGARQPGEDVVIRYLRDGEEREATLTTTRSDDGRPLIGVLPGLVGLEYPFDVSIVLPESLPEIGGPSAGLMFALGIVDKLTPGPLTGGRVVAGTGAIDTTGAVSPIGGIRQKLIAAREYGAEVFLTPAANCAAAVGGIPDGLRLVRVETLDDAVTGLEQLAAGGDPPGCDGA
ncbi:MAG: PDZ domain-containing protein [Actinomycetota bacterium]|nr:PDZ domain-containing protein [Actinomycetota bacterium]